MNKRDLILISAVLAIAGIISLFSYIRSSASTGSNLIVELYVDGAVYKSIPITEKEKAITVETSYGKNFLKIHDGGVEMTGANCPDQVCKGFGFIDKAGGIIVCLPHHLYIEIKGTSD
jgi:hypothetical protein